MLEITYESNIGEKLQGLAAEFRAARAELLTEAGNRLKEALDSRITASGLRDIHGKVRSWQVQYRGSGGGYVALRPTNTSTGDNSPGAITNYLEHGHRIRPRGTGKGYRPRIRVAYVNGYHFYRVTQGEAGEILRAEGKAFCEKLAKGLEGTG